MLDTGGDAALLDAVDVGGAEDAAQEGVLSEGLEAAAEERRALEADRRSQQDVDAARPGLLAEKVSDLVEQLGVESRSHAGGGRQHGTRVLGHGLCLA